MSELTQTLINLAQEGEIEELINVLEEANAEEDELNLSVYQWLTVAGQYGSDEADEMAEDLLDAEMDQLGDEVIAGLHLDVAEWFTYEEEGFPKDQEMVLEQLRRAQEFGLRENLQDADETLLIIKEKLDDEHQQLFEELFPELNEENVA